MKKVPAFTPRIVQVAFENSAAEDPYTFFEEGLLYHPHLVITRYEKQLQTDTVTFMIWRVVQCPASEYFTREKTFSQDMLFKDSEDLLLDMVHLTVADFLNKYLVQTKMT
ncbi:hypothetical protein CBW65_04325 [Tumebacillus avium]|uniref:Uncharacterized protein n=1 Tax=Tumebacillus avium TaxID=1903704 RepID=A0A1Y0IKM0_9BACL|nr:hypothetical protein [Tumebacillus avium]ARU60376.1 hypothetical protein CBW65_04325 [Tumebacillus avium]